VKLNVGGKRRTISCARQKSPLFLSGRFIIEPGDSTLGSEPESKIVLPEKAPGQVGTITRQGRDFHFLAAAGSAVAVNEKPAAGRVSLHVAASPEPSDRFAFGDFHAAIRPVGADFYSLLLDKQSVFARNFKGKTWFPIQPEYCVPAELVRSEHPITQSVRDTSGSTRTLHSPGDLVFRIGGQNLRLEAFGEGDQLLIMFRDKTSMHETYPGGRFVEVAMPNGKLTTIDFNKAYNPYCAFNPDAMCPIPPERNRLPIRIAAGETYHAPR